jgi:hypothetical protein
MKFREAKKIFWMTWSSLDHVLFVDFVPVRVFGDAIMFVGADLLSK